MNLKSAFIKATKKIGTKNNESADLEAEIFLSFILRRPREFILAHPEIKLNFWQNWKLNRLISQRIKGTPVAYLIGHKEFYGLDFIVNKNVLVPRPETELIVDETVKTIDNSQLPIVNFIDVGTGSGCIIITLAKLLAKKYSDLNFYGLDISKKALAVAPKNALKNDVDGCIHFLYSDLLNNIDKNIFNKPTIITANLPYLTLEQIKNSPTIQKEPRIALLGGADGLDYYRSLFKQVQKIFTEFKKEIMIFCEIDETQVIAINKLALIEFPGANLETIKDLSGFARVVKIKLGS